MRKGMGLLLAMCILVSGIMLAQPVNSGNVEVSVDALAVHAPIRIDSNADFTLANGVNNTGTGTGSAGNPWIIENLMINGTGAGYCLYIGNTTDYFVVRNCSLYNASGLGGNTYYADSGLILYNVQNGTVSNVSAASNNNSGIFMYSSRNNTVYNNNFTMNAQYGLYLNSSSFNNLGNNTVSNSTDGIYLDWSNNNTMTNNSVLSANDAGIVLSQSRGASLFDNSMLRRGILVYGGDAAHWNTHIIDQSNIMDGKPVYYRKYQNGGTIPAGAGQVILANCSGATVENETLINGTVGISLGYSANITVANCTIDSGGLYGIWAYQSPNATVINNTVLSAGYYGIAVYASSRTLIIDNNVSGNQNGIELASAADGRVENNTISWNYGNGLNLMSGSSNSIINNTIRGNQNYGIYRWLSTGIIYHNNIINNTNQAFGNGNSQCQWDNGYPSGGNYWDDYSGNDVFYGPNQDMIGIDGIGDIAYSIAGGTNADKYPLMRPYTGQALGPGVAAPPFALNHTPASNATDVPINSAIRITWNETMNWTSVEDAFSYTDGLNNYSSANGTWLHDAASNISTFTPSSGFAYETLYFAAVNCTATDIIGNPLDQDRNGTGGYWPADVLRWNFTTTDAAPYVVSTSPAHNQVNVDPASAITVTFSEPMNQSATEIAFSYTNGVQVFTTANGTEIWNAQRTEFTFIPVPPLEKNQTYVMSVNGSMARDMGGKIMGGVYSWSFTTWREPPPPHVIDTYPISGAFNVPVNTHINLVFDMEMDIAAVEGAFSYTDGNNTWNATDGTADWFSGNTLFSFQPSHILNFDSTYTVILDTNATSTYGKTLDGNANGIAEPKDDYVFTFTTALEPPTIVSHYPGKDQSNVSTGIPAIYINFSKQMDTTSVTNGVSIYPNTGYTPSFSADHRNLTLLLNDKLLEATQYRVTIMSTARDIAGIQIDGNGDGAGGDRFSFTFFTEGVVALKNPVITYIFPAMNSTVPVDSFLVSITFSNLMNRTSVENAFSFSNSSSQINGTFSWRMSGRTVMFTPQNALEHNTTYTVSINTTAMDSNGLRMLNTTTWSYTTEPAPDTGSLKDMAFYAAILFLAVMTIMLYRANRSLRMELKKSRVLLKRAMKKYGFTEDELKKKKTQEPEPARESVEGAVPESETETATDEMTHENMGE